MFDVRTAFLIWGIQALTLAILLITVWLHDRQRSYYIWLALGFAAHGLGVVVVGIRPLLPFNIPPHTVTLLAMLGLAFWITGLRRLDDRSPSLASLLPLAVWTMAMLLPLPRDIYYIQVVLHQVPNIVGFLIMARIVATSRVSSPKYRHLLTGVWSIQALNNLLVAVYAAMNQPGSFAELTIVPYIGVFGIICLVAAIVLLTKIIMDKSELRLKDLARTDPLTGALNRRGLIESLPAMKARCGKDRQLALLVFDLDFFKHINDSFGHQSGDTVLTAFATMVRGTIGSKGLFARSGGEEFSAILPVDELRQAAFHAEQIRQMVAVTPIATESGIVRLTVSAGLCASPPESFDFDKMMSRADTALYAAKAEGRNRVAVAKESSYFCLTPTEDSGTPAAIDSEADRQVAALRRLSKRITPPA
ncbi:GGDEF domain-containing protein [Rhizobium paknamense]|uniref:diguanylate cyclase n=1 Tax=Rhizobium paknamense TaxID=1206817 RepID=A0ABU0I735_9HYPH|nr:GGDEF domain-containing protein [Rhizobium paknamense]MDQ0454037.1 diguanylate cyclase (GGDEF)-like protein [Rhizobium paknamense]